MAKDYVWADDDTMSQALKSVLFYFDRPREKQDASHVQRSLIQGLIDYLSEDLACDHSVNICCCADAALVEELQRILRGEMLCPDCHGEGYTYSQELYDKRKAELLAQWGGEQWYDIGDSEGYMDCGRCNKTGAVRMEVV